MNKINGIDQRKYIRNSLLKAVGIFIVTPILLTVGFSHISKNQKYKFTEITPWENEKKYEGVIKKDSIEYEVSFDYDNGKGWTDLKKPGNGIDYKFGFTKENDLLNEDFGKIKLTNFSAFPPTRKTRHLFENKKDSLEKVARHFYNEVQKRLKNN